MIVANRKVFLSFAFVRALVTIYEECLGYSTGSGTQLAVWDHSARPLKLMNVLMQNQKSSLINTRVVAEKPG